MKYIVYILTGIFFLNAAVLFAAGKKEEGEYTRVHGLKTWNYTDDISALPDGPYNIIVKAEDTAGNSTTAGPYNIFVNAQSDLATVRIANPTEGMIVSDNLNVVGGAFDDDSVSLVELKIDDGPYKKCTGTSFWSYYLDLKNLTEGIHSITLRATDSNNLKGIEKSVTFTVDKNPPYSTVTSHKQGSILSGTVTLHGTVSDTGGVKELLFSSDGISYKKIKISRNRKTGLWDFSQKINTKRMKDGNYTYWYKSVDKSGATGSSSFLFFVDNTPPRITIIHPSGGETVNGKTSFTGEVTDTIGTKSITLSIGSDTVPVVLRPGDPYWVVDIDLNEYAGASSAVLEAVDFSGNRTRKRVRFNNNTKSDNPVLSLFSPDKIGIRQPVVAFGISITDDDGVKGYEYSLDKNPPKSVISRGAAVLSFRSLEPGRHTLKVTPYDVHDVPGKTVSKSFTVPKPSLKSPSVQAPAISFAEPSGRIIGTDAVTISGRVSSTAGLKTIEYSVATGADPSWHPVQADAATGTFSIVLPAASLKEGSNVVAFRAVDLGGTSSTAYTAFIRDSLPPELKLFTPVKDEAVNGKITVSGAVSDLSPRFTYEFSTDGKTYKTAGTTPFFHFTLDCRSLQKKNETLFFRTSDSEGNTKIFSFPLTVDAAADTPVVTLQFPAEAATLRGRSNLSGTAFDDDGIQAIYYAFDKEKFSKVRGGSTFNIPVPLAKLKDSVHTVHVKAEDVNGVFSTVVTRSFSVSRSGPIIQVESPQDDTYVKGSAVIQGTARDPNGIKSVYVSIDNGASYVKTHGGTQWSLSIDTTLLTDGTHSLYVKAYDNAGTVSYYTTIINIDNTVPALKLDSPLNGGEAGDIIAVDGRAFDNTALNSLTLEVLPLQHPKTGNSDTVTVTLDPQAVIHKKISTDQFPPGWYTLRVKAVDKAGNITFKTRSIKVKPKDKRGTVHLLYPLEGTSCNAFLKVEGTVTSDQLPSSVIIVVDNKIIGTADVTETGNFTFTMDSSLVSTGDHTLLVKSSQLNSKIQSAPRSFHFNTEGPWIQFKRSSGTFLTKRTFITGTLGYKTGTGEKAPKVKAFVISYDNGRTFSAVKAGKVWKSRIETELYPDGELPVIAKVTYGDNTIAVAKMTLTIDKTPPEVTLDQPKEGENFNNSLRIQGSSSDNEKVGNVTFLLRAGDKNAYGVPSFIQGLYMDFHGLGATYGEFGVGLTFFDNNVKLQASAGLAPPGRFSGTVFAGKLLANVAAIPYSFLFGPDWQNFTMSFAVGADFSYFSMSGNGVVLGSIIGQWELVRYKIPQLSMFNTYSLYVEGSLWFISSDVQAGVIPRYSIGTRIGLF